MPLYNTYIAVNNLPPYSVGWVTAKPMASPGLELEKALAKALNAVSTLLAPQIITSKGKEVVHVSGTM